VAITGPVDGPDFRLECNGPSARIPASFEKLVPGDIAGIAIDAHAVQPYYAGLLARLSRMRINAALEGPAVVITARPVA
jgi:histidine phosphotransferase ChpT